MSLDLGVPSDEKKGLTLVRTIIEMSYIAVTAGTGSSVHAGIYLVEDDALSAGAFAEPGDSGDDAGWVWRLMNKPVYTSVSNDSSQQTLIKADIRAMRKYPGEDYSMAMIIEVPAGGNSTINTNGMVRMLFKRA